MTEDKKRMFRFAAICFFIGSAAFYLASVIGSISGSHTAVLYMALGSSLLCLGGGMFNRTVNEV